jgi:hypothetical protein
VLVSEVITELNRLTSELSKGYEALYEAECNLAEADLRLDKTEQKAFINAQGTVADRTSLARLESAEDRFQRDLRRAEVNRIKTKIRALESALTASQTMARLLEAESRL